MSRRRFLIFSLSLVPPSSLPAGMAKTVDGDTNSAPISSFVNPCIARRDFEGAFGSAGSGKEGSAPLMSGVGNRLADNFSPSTSISTSSSTSFSPSSSLWFSSSVSSLSSSSCLNLFRFVVRTFGVEGPAASAVSMSIASSSSTSGTIEEIRVAEDSVPACCFTLLFLRSFFFFKYRCLALVFS